ncbi:MAG: hypothetical protein ACK4YP_17520 [Myxococcota bacterium]
MPGLILLVAAAWASGAVWASCTADIAALDAETGRALAAYADLDLDTFAIAESSARRLAPCLTEPATPSAAWELHVVHGLAAWVDRDADRTRAAFRGARATSPAGDLSPLLAPDGSHARVLWVAAGMDGEGPVVAAPPGRWGLDGADHATSFPAERAALVQRFTRDGRVVRTWYFPEGVDLGELRSPRRRPRLFAGGALTVGGGAAIATAGLLRVLYLSAPETEALEGVAIANPIVGALGFVALGTGVTLVTIEALRW